jgi:hypothetical protein
MLHYAYNNQVRDVMKLLNKILGASALLLATALPSAHADILLSFSNAGAFSGNAPAGPGTNVYATASFVDTGANTVRLTMSVLNGVGLPAGTFVNDWYFNLIGGNSAGLTYTLVPGSTPYDTLDTTATVDCCKADGTGGDFDLAFHFNTGAPGNELAAGNTSIYDISGTGLSAALFDALSQNVDGGGLGFTGAVHVQGYGDSVWLGTNPCRENCGGTPPQETPEPGTLAILGTGLIGLAYLRRRRHI